MPEIRKIDLNKVRNPKLQRLIRIYQKSGDFALHYFDFLELQHIKEVMAHYSKAKLCKATPKCVEMSRKGKIFSFSLNFEGKIRI